MTGLTPPIPPPKIFGPIPNRASKSKSKIIYFVRHAEAAHNIKEREAVQAAIANGVTCKEEQEKARRSVLNDEKLKDAPLSPDGKQQVRRKLHDLTLLNALCSRSGSSGSISANSNASFRSSSEGSTNSINTTGSKSSTFMKYSPPQVVLVSPLRRALMTATELFYKAKNSIQDASEPPIKFVALEILREKRTGFFADERSDVNILEQEFPHVDFTNVRQSQYKEAGGITVLPGEDNTKVRKRCKKFIESDHFNQLEATSVAIVTHKGWLRELRHTIKGYVDTNKVKVDFDLESWHQTLYKNAEIRIAEFLWDHREMPTCETDASSQLVSSIISRSVENALGSVVEDAVQHLIRRASIQHSLILQHQQYHHQEALHSDDSTHSSSSRSTIDAAAITSKAKKPKLATPSKNVGTTLEIVPQNQ